MPADPLPVAAQAQSLCRCTYVTGSWCLSLKRVAKLWVAVLNISPTMEQKLIHKHHVEPFEVRQEVVCVEGLPAWRKYDRQRGLRWIVPIEIRREGYVVVLYPVPYETDVYNLGTCHERS